MSIEDVIVKVGQTYTARQHTLELDDCKHIRLDKTFATAS